MSKKTPRRRLKHMSKKTARRRLKHMNQEAKPAMPIELIQLIGAELRLVISESIRRQEKAASLVNRYDKAREYADTLEMLIVKMRQYFRNEIEHGEDLYDVEQAARMLDCGEQSIRDVMHALRRIEPKRQ